MDFPNSLRFCIYATLLVLITCVSGQRQRQLSIGERARRPANQCSTNYGIDYVLLSLQWPTSFCWEKQSCNRQVDQNQWQIHGLWPQRRSGEWPQFCCSDSNFNTSSIEPLMGQLLKKWKSLRADAKHSPFWKHEWTKHGTCAQSLPQLRGQFNYFNTTLHLYDLFPLNEWLNKRQINASNHRNYSLNTIHESIEYELKSRVRIECSIIPDSLPILTEIHICLNKTSLQPINCVHRDDRQCGTNSVRFPANS